MSSVWCHRAVLCAKKSLEAPARCGMHTADAAPKANVMVALFGSAQTAGVEAKWISAVSAGPREDADVAAGNAAIAARLDYRASRLLRVTALHRARMPVAGYLTHFCWEGTSCRSGMLGVVVAIDKRGRPREYEPVIDTRNARIFRVEQVVSPLRVSDLAREHFRHATIVAGEVAATEADNVASWRNGLARVLADAYGPSIGLTEDDARNGAVALIRGVLLGRPQGPRRFGRQQKPIRAPARVARSQHSGLR